MNGRVLLQCLAVNVSHDKGFVKDDGHICIAIAQRKNQKDYVNKLTFSKRELTNLPVVWIYHLTVVIC